jgi:hypothetical protein
MSGGATNDLGSVVALWRYPVKSMMGEELNASDLGKRGVLGDRVYAIVDAETGKVASAKNPKKWPHLFDCRATYVEPPGSSEELPPVRLTLPDGRVTRSDDADFNDLISGMLGRPGQLQMPVPEKPIIEEYWPDIEGLALRETVTDEDGRFEVRRFMTTLPQGDLPRDPGILRAAAQHSDANVVGYAEVEQGGSVRRGDGVRAE